VVDHQELVMAVVQGGGIAGTCPGTTPVAGCTMMVGCSSGMAGASGVLVDQQGTVGSQQVWRLCRWEIVSYHGFRFFCGMIKRQRRSMS